MKKSEREIIAVSIGQADLIRSGKEGPSLGILWCDQLFPWKEQTGGAAPIRDSRCAGVHGSARSH